QRDAAASPCTGDDRMLLDDARRVFDVRERADDLEQVGAEAVVVAGMELERRVAGYPARDLPRRRRDARVRHHDGEHERDADRDPGTGEQLLDRVGAQALAVEVEECLELLGLASCATATSASSTIRPAASRPSLNV